MKLIFMDFDKTIIENDIIDDMKKNLKGYMKGLWDDYEKKWHKNKITNIECLINQIKLFDDCCKKISVDIEKVIINEELKKFFNQLQKKQIKIFILSDNDAKLILQVIKKLNENLSQKVCSFNGKCATQIDIIDFINSNTDKFIYIFANKIENNNFLFPYRELSIKMGDTKNPICKKCLKFIIEDCFNDIEETIFIGCNKTEADIELAKNCDKVFICKNSKINFYNQISYSSFEEVLEKIK